MEGLTKEQKCALTELNRYAKKFNSNDLNFYPLTTLTTKDCKILVDLIAELNNSAGNGYVLFNSIYKTFKDYSYKVDKKTSHIPAENMQKIVTEIWEALKIYERGEYNEK